mmetsp:Transcript_23314/g.49869  ORF Transcript_23314/g.49869 Transcript_23314/m.49869 type:complete len:175 (-) Transcript_23314:3-527(-)
MDLIVGFSSRTSRPEPPRVSFATHLEIVQIEDLSRDRDGAPNKSDLYYSEADIRSFKRHASLTMRAVRDSGSTMAQFAERNVRDTSAFMGLERYLSDTTTREIRYQREALHAAVLGEQRRQQLEASRGGDGCGTAVDPERMARVSEKATEWCRRRARIIALIHAEKRSATTQTT